MQARIRYSEPCHNHNGILTHWMDREELVSMDDNGEAIGEQILHLLAASCKVNGVETVLFDNK